METQKIRDFLYFDIDKASSLLSQFEWGLIDQISIKQEEIDKKDIRGKAGIHQIAEVDLGRENQSDHSLFETKKLHHDLLNRIEAQLIQANLVVNLTNSYEEIDCSSEKIREIIGNKPYVIAQGWSVIEDYRRILTITDRYNSIMDFINKSQMETLKQNPDFLELQSQIEQLRQEIKSIKDPNKKTLQTSKLKRIETQLNVMLNNEIKQNNLDQWLIDGINYWIDTFMPNRINFRIYPFEKVPSFQILCNLKRDCFVDQNLEHLLYGYGNFPNIPLAVFGLITSIPPKNKAQFNPMTELENNNSTDVAFEKGLRTIFGAMEEIESLIRFSRYPNITIHPIAVFREFTTSE